MNPNLDAFRELDNLLAEIQTFLAATNGASASSRKGFIVKMRSELDMRQSANPFPDGSDARAFFDDFCVAVLNVKFTTWSTGIGRGFCAKLRAALVTLREALAEQIATQQAIASLSGSLDDLDSIPNRVLDAVQRFPNSTARELAQRLRGVASRDVQDALAALTASGQVVSRRDGRRITHVVNNLKEPERIPTSERASA